MNDGAISGVLAGEPMGAVRVLASMVRVDADYSRRHPICLFKTVFGQLLALFSPCLIGACARNSAKGMKWYRREQGVTGSGRPYCRATELFRHDVTHMLVLLGRL